MLPLESVDEAAGIAKTGVSATYEMGTCRGGCTILGATVWVENIIEVLDEPGEWVLNTQTGEADLWPANPSDAGSPHGYSGTEYL